MTRKEANDLVSEIISAVDYDIWKDLFVEECMEDDPREVYESWVRPLEDIVLQTVNKK